MNSVDFAFALSCMLL